jgi:Zn-dependent M28 family amino/carboxypeptidase
MKTIIPFLLIICVFSCKPSKQIQVSDAVDTIISKEELSNIIDTLSNDYYEGRETGAEGINKAAIYIQNFLKDNHVKPFYTNSRDSFEVYGYKAFNVIGVIEGNDEKLKNEYIILSAHYDHEGKISGEADSVYNGANDNASGVSTVLNIAKIIASSKSNKRSIIVALFSAEEKGLLGSEQFANKLKSSSLTVYCAANIDMIGSVLTNQKGKVYLSGYKKSNMVQVLNKYIGSEEIVYWQKEENYGLFGLSDNYPIYQVLNVPSHTFCTFDFNNYPYYHKVDDEIDKIDMDNTVIIANNICLAIRKIAESSDYEIKLK